MSSITINQKKPDNEIKQFFDTFFTDSISYPANEVDAVVGFFESRGFSESSATSVSTVLLRQAKIDNVNTFALLDTLKGFSELQLSSVVAEILNYNRPKSSVLGYKLESTEEVLETRNIKT